MSVGFDVGTILELLTVAFLVLVFRAGWAAALIWQDRICDPELEDERE